ncbi:hypothetical protein ANRL1_01736 [Anaerolineae bacterium]|nr:hypothetical protein ANRL1_01736 [Anaerolineae bacterium]
MTEEEIRMRLDELSETFAARDVARIDYEKARQRVIPDDIRAALTDMDAEFTLRDAAIALNIEELEKEIKQLVLAHGVSVKGTHAHAVWNKPRVNWDAKRLDRYAAQHPDVLVFRSEGEASVALRKT